MTQVSPEEKQKAKAAAANLAVAANDAAVFFGVAGAVVAVGGVASGFGAAAGVGAGAALALCSFGSWYIGNRYQRLANDPPRDDFDVVTVTAASSNEAGQSIGDPDIAARMFAVHQILLADALDCLVTSLERCDGALQSGAADAAQAQAVAARQNAMVVQSLQAVLADCAAVLDAAWAASTPDLSALNLDTIKSVYLDAAGPPHRSPGQPLQSVLDGMSGLDQASLFANLDPQQDPILSLAELPAAPVLLVGPEFSAGMAELSSALANLVNDDDAVG